VDERAVTKGILIIGLLTLGAADVATALHRTALDQVAGATESRAFTLKVDLREPGTRGESAQAPALERGGWHHHNPQGPILIGAGSRVEVTGVYNYSERGFFLEVAADPDFSGETPLTSRKRMRFRVMVDTPATNPSGQAAEAFEFLGKVFVLEVVEAPPSSPSP